MLRVRAQGAPQYLWEGRRRAADGAQPPPKVVSGRLCRCACVGEEELWAAPNQILLALEGALGLVPGVSTGQYSPVPFRSILGKGWLGDRASDLLRRAEGLSRARQGRLWPFRSRSLTSPWGPALARTSGALPGSV